MSNDQKRIVELFIEISAAGKQRRRNALLAFLVILAGAIFAAIHITIAALLVPVIFFIALRPLINPLHDKNIANYLVQHKDRLHPALISKVKELSKETKLDYCKEALMAEIRSKLQQKNLLPPDEKK